MAEAPSHPLAERVDVALRDGSTVRVRPVCDEDAPAVREFLGGISRESIWFRFFGAADLNRAARFFLDVDFENSFALVVEHGDPPRLIAHALFVRIAEERAEVAFLVGDAWQGHGIATILLAHLASAAEARGITTFVAEVLPDNHRMIQVFRDSGFVVDARSTRDAIEITLPTSLTASARARFEERERDAAVAAVDSFLAPRSVAVVGASRRPDSVGGLILHNLLDGGYTGAVYPVNPHAHRIQSTPAFPSVLDLPQAPELAVVAVPAEQVVNTARQCAAAGTRALLVISAGFAETGEEGRRRQEELLELCRETGMRLVGPNCFGVVNTADRVRLNATFAAMAPPSGRIGLLSQSGGVGLAIMAAAARRSVGISSFVSVGNKTDISGNDLLEYWEQDPDTQVALLYLESVGNPRKFARIAPRVGRHKPVLAVKSGRSAAGARATSSHTGALLSASDATVGALFEQAGVIRADTLPELLDVAELLAFQPVPAGDRLVIVTNGGGPGILCADAALAAGVAVPELGVDLQRELRSALPVGASVANPVDMIATATAEDYRRTLKAVVAADVADAVLCIYVPSLGSHAEDVAAAIRSVAEEPSPRPTMAAVFMTGDGAPASLTSSQVRVPHYDFPEDAARAVARAARHGQWRSRDPGRRVTFADARADEARAIISRAFGAGQDWLSPVEVRALLDCYGLPLIPTEVIDDPEAAVTLARRWRRPLALKAVAPGLVHKSDAGGVRLGVAGPGAIRAAAADIERSVAAAGFKLSGLVVQPMAPTGIELIVGVVNDGNFGPVVACGAGGTAAELIQDVAVRITPLTDLDASRMLGSLRTSPLLAGYRGAPGVDLGVLQDLLLRVSAMVETHPEIAELDCNPVSASAEGAWILDARVRVEPAPPEPPVPSLRA